MRPWLANVNVNPEAEVEVLDFMLTSRRIERAIK